MASNWNMLMAGLARVGLGEHEQRVLAAVARKTLGYRKTADKLSVSQLVKLTGLDRRNVQRALAGLENRGIVVRDGGSCGRGNAATITLNLDVNTWREKACEETPFKRRPTRRLSAGRKGVSGDTKKASHGTHTRGKGVNLPASSKDGDIVRRAFDAYVGAGGILRFERERGALARSVTSLVKASFEERTILAACKDVGSRQEFPGYLRQRAEAIASEGGACEWDGLDRSQLTVSQLGLCPCARCVEWADAKAVAA